MLLKDIFNTYNLQDPINYKLLHKAIQDRFVIHSGDVISLIFNVSNTNQSLSNKIFDLNILLSGYVIWDNYNISLKALLFDLNSYVIEGKVFGVITAIGVILGFYGWFSISNNFQSIVHLQQLSVHSFILHIGFDFSFSLFIFDLSMTTSRFSLLYSFLFLTMLSVYFGIQMKLLAQIWRAHNSEIADADMNEIRFAFFKFFGEVSILMSLSSLAISSVFTEPFICLSYLYSFFLPQIIHSCLIHGKKSGDLIFIFLVSLTRLFPLWYFTLYDRNLIGTNSNFVAIIITLWVLIQISIIHLQNKFGGAFFLPKSYRPQSFNYFPEQIPIGIECAICMSLVTEQDEGMLTPCSHVFHKDCLSRWMEEQLICPICRSRLPPILEDIVN